MSQSLNHPQPGFIQKTTITVPAGETVALPRPTFPTGDGVNYGHIGLLYQFDGDNTQDLELVVDEADTLGTTIPSGTPWDYGGSEVTMFAKGYYRYLHNATGSATDITTTITRVK